jgi:ABC-type multidrug transport system fused ATPase/permease subunit
MRTRSKPTTPAEAAPPLSQWLRVFAPAYRAMLAWLTALNLLSAVAVFIELQLLRSLTVVLSRPTVGAEGGCGIGAWASSGFSIDAQPCGANLPLLLLSAYAVTIVWQSGVDLAAFACNSRLTQRARHDVERELLRNLLKQDDAFYLRRSPSEIISRLGGDLQRVGGRRQIVTQAISTGLSVIAVVWVLLEQSWLAASVGAAISIIGVVAAAPMLRRQRGLDQRMILSDEQVKAGFEDTLQGVAEIQVSGLIRSVLRRFEQRQAVRDRAALENADLNSRITVSQKLTFTIGFIAALSLVVFTDWFRDGGQVDGGEGSATAGLIVVLIATLPQLYYKFGDLTQLFSQFQIADVSASRLRQYEAPTPLQTRAPATARDGAIVLDRVSYQFSGSHAVQGGAEGISLVVPPRGLMGVVGPAGAGKSTLIRLILGRQRPLNGSIAYPGDGGPDAAFVYLPQRPILFDASLRDNLFLNTSQADATALEAVGDRLGALGLLDLVRQKGLEAMPAADAVRGVDLVTVRAGFQAAAETALGAALHPFGPGHAAPRQTAIEAQLGCAVDQEELARRLTSAHSREPVRALAALPFARAMADLATALIRRTAPLLSQAGTPDDYNRIAVVKLETGTWQLRAAALDAVMQADEPPPATPPHPLLIAVALTARIEELEDSALPVPESAARAQLEKIVSGIARPLQAGALNPLLTWRENLLFAVPDPANFRRLEQVDRVVMDHLRASPLDRAVLEAGLDCPVGRQGGRLSGGQQQLVALGRALLSPSPFLVLDEPSSAFHPRLRAALVSVLQVEAQSRSVIVVTHDMDLARGCEQIVFVRDGALAGHGSWDSMAADNADFKNWIDHDSQANA